MTSVVIRKGPIGSSHLVRWCAAQENWHKIHYDVAFATDDGLAERVVNGALKQHFLAQAAEAVLPEAGWLWRLDFRFNAPDYVGDSLTVTATDLARTAGDGYDVLELAVEIHNDQRGVTTTARALGLVPTAGARPPLCQLPDGARLPPSWEPIADAHPPLASSPSDATPLDAWIGKRLETVQSDYPIDLSRLRLFSTAVMDMPPLYWSEAAARASKWSCIVAPPLFVLHAAVGTPDTDVLSHDRRADGREAGAREVGRNIHRLFDLPFQRVLNGGSRIEVLGRARLGDYPSATSTLLQATLKHGSSGEMLVVESLNEYASSGRLVLREQQTVILH